MITREKITGLIGAIIFMVLLLVILLFSYFTLASPSQELEGIPVMFGNIENASGSEEPPMRDITPPPPVVEKVIIPQKAPSKAPLIAQSNEPSLAIQEQKKKEKERIDQQEREKRVLLAEQQRIQDEADRKKREEEARRSSINKEMSGLFGESTSGSRGNTQGEGIQGVTTGNSNQGAPTGVGGIGSYDLGGRSVGSGGLKQPSYNVDDYGTVKVTITVDPRGNVISAEIGKGTNTPSSTLRNEAIKAARSTKFNSITSANNQQGTITYKFNLN
ncbi:MAG: cell envelope integrity protein TolA [Candidatus Saccharimonadaceae bacterium]